MAGKRTHRKRHQNHLTGLLLSILLLLSAALAWNIHTMVTANQPAREEEAAGDPGPVPEPEKKPGEMPSLDIQQPEPAAPPEEPSEEAPPEELVQLPETQPAEKELPSCEIPESDAVEDGYFANTVFLGNSRTEGFKLFSGLREGTFVYGTGATVDSIFRKTTWTVDGETMPVLDAVQRMDPDQIYTMFGTNELGWVRIDLFKEHYGKVVDRLREDHPEAEIILQSIMPVSRQQEEKHSYVNNERIELFNDVIRELAEEKGCWYLDVQTAVADEDGFLREEFSADGVHLNRAGCTHWRDYLKTHTV